MHGADDLIEGAITGEASLVAVREHLREQAVAAGLGLVAQTRLVTAGSELGRNVLVHAGTGTFCVERIEGPQGPGVRARFTDQGPGIHDLGRAMTDGYSSVMSLGIGLPGSRRLVDEFDIESAPGQGTVVTIVMWAR